MSSREGEEGGSTPSRTGRFYSENGEWFVSTREGKPIGPFQSREEAEAELANFIDFLFAAEPDLLVKYFKSFFKEDNK